MSRPGLARPVFRLDPGSQWRLESHLLANKWSRWRPESMTRDKEFCVHCNLCMLAAKVPCRRQFAQSRRDWTNEVANVMATQSDNAGRICRSNLKTGPAQPGHAKIALYITAVEFYQFSLYRNYGLFAPKTIRSWERKFQVWNFRSLVLSKRMEDGAKVRNRERKFHLWNFRSH